MIVKRLTLPAVLVVPLLFYLHGEENRLVHYLEARGYSDVQMEHPNQFHGVRGWPPYSYRARSPGGPPVHGGGPASATSLSRLPSRSGRNRRPEDEWYR